MGFRYFIKTRLCAALKLSILAVKCNLFYSKIQISSKTPHLSVSAIVLLILNIFKLLFVLRTRQYSKSIVQSRWNWTISTTVLVWHLQKLDFCKLFIFGTPTKNERIEEISTLAKLQHDFLDICYFVCVFFDSTQSFMCKHTCKLTMVTWFKALIPWHLLCCSFLGGVCFPFVWYRNCNSGEHELSLVERF